MFNFLIYLLITFSSFIMQDPGPGPQVCVLEGCIDLVTVDYGDGLYGLEVYSRGSSSLNHGVSMEIYWYVFDMFGKLVGLGRDLIPYWYDERELIPLVAGQHVYIELRVICWKCKIDTWAYADTKIPPF